MQIETNNTRRFRHIDGVAVLAIFDQNRSFTTYAEVVEGNRFDLSTARTYWPDEIEELR